MKTNLNKQVDDVLNSLEGIQQAEAPNFFYTRLAARMQQSAPQSLWEAIAAFIAKPTVVVVGICLIIFLNLSLLLRNKSISTAGYAIEEISVADNEDVLANSSFEYENIYAR